MLATASADGVCLFDPSTSSVLPVAVLTPHSRHATADLAWSHNGQVLATCGADGRVVLLSAPSGAVFAALPERPDTPVELTCLAFAPGSAALLCGLAQAPFVAVWDLRRRQRSTSVAVQPQPSAPTSAACHSAEQLAALGHSDGSVAVQNLATAAAHTVRLAGAPGAVRRLSFSPAPKALVACADDSGSVSVVDARAHAVVNTFAAAHSAPATGVAFSPADAAAAVSAGLDRRLLLLDVRAARPSHALVCSVPLASVAVHENGHTAAAGGNDGTVLVFDLRRAPSGVPLAVLQTRSAHSVVALAFQAAAGLALGGVAGGTGGRGAAVRAETEASAARAAPAPAPAQETARAGAGRGALAASLFSPLQSAPAAPAPAPAPAARATAQPAPRMVATDLFSPLRPEPDAAPAAAAGPPLKVGAVSPVAAPGAAPGGVRAGGTARPDDDDDDGMSQYLESIHTSPGTVAAAAPASTAGQLLSLPVPAPAPVPVVPAARLQGGVRPAATPHAPHVPPAGSASRAAQRMHDAGDGSSGGGRARRAESGQAGAAELSEAVLRSVLGDLLVAEREAIHSDISALHSDVLRHSLAQQRSIERLAAELDAARAEIVALRREVAALTLRQFL
eukprot:TRINITY_DN3556_c1_g1_i6.p2 TRINITY_DN3556_c1_g1~~TRINITY_DN3556_c1_g1_i6.p2  ORF type:complete len:644 (-),score=182.41 TRINITY_DN3556_c1_g1_i6:25-1887(-)